MKEKWNSRTAGAIGLLISALFWATGYLFVKQALDSISPYYLLAVRFTTAGVILMVIFAGRLKQMTPGLLRGGVWMGIALFFEFLTYTLGLKYTVPSKASFIVAAYIIILPLVYFLIRRKLPKKQEIGAAVLCMAGVALILAGSMNGLNQGDALMGLCAVSYAFHIVLSAKYARRYDGPLLNIVQIMTTAVLSIVLSLILDGAPAALNGGQVKSILYMAVCATIIPYLLCLFGQKRVSTTTSGILLSFESVFATAMSILVLHERISLQFMAGGALVIGAAVLSEWSFEGKGNSKGKNKKEKGDDNGKGINETE